jgi:tRNA (uracil-5-)-methyltransferase TRM9
MVHDVYETIAPHFSQTRYKPWPIIARFLSSIPEHSIGLDSGAGNGKYLPVVREGSKGSRMIALDRSSGLLSVARAQKGEVGDDVVGGVEECVRGDLAFDGWRKGVFVSRTRRFRQAREDP